MLGEVTLEALVRDQPVARAVVGTTCGRCKLAILDRCGICFYLVCGCPMTRGCPCTWEFGKTARVRLDISLAVMTMQEHPLNLYICVQCNFNGAAPCQGCHLPVCANCCFRGAIQSVDEGQIMPRWFADRIVESSPKT